MSLLREHKSMSAEAVQKMTAAALAAMGDKLCSHESYSLRRIARGALALDIQRSLWNGQCYRGDVNSNPNKKVVDGKNKEPREARENETPVLHP